MNNEERVAAELTARDGQAVSAVIHSIGWTKVIKPALLNRELALIDDFRSAKTYEEFVGTQQAINAIRNLLSFIEVALIEGQKAFNNLEGKSQEETGDPQGA